MAVVNRTNQQSGVIKLLVGQLKTDTKKDKQNKQAESFHAAFQWFSSLDEEQAIIDDSLFLLKYLLS